jgi:hypothetical protein
MDCRTFQNNLEDYLQNGLDFAGRFGMERHAQQCIACGKEMAGAQRLGRLVRELDHVRAPSTFEASVIDEIGKRKLNSRFFRIHRNWISGLEGLSFRKWAAVAAMFVILGLGILVWLNRAAYIQVPSPPRLAFEPGKIETQDQISDSSTAKPQLPVATQKTAAETRTSGFPKAEPFADLENLDAEYIEFSIVGPDNLPANFPLPKKIRVHYGQPSEEYYIQNVSH